MARRGGGGAAQVSMAFSGGARLNGILKASGDNKHPEWRAGAERITQRFADEQSARGGSMQAEVRRSNNLYGPTVGTTRVRHPGAKAREFGRRNYYRGFTGNNRPGSPRPTMKTGQRFRSSPGQAERPFVGIKRGDAAVAATQPHLESELQRTIQTIWATAPEEAL